MSVQTQNLEENKAEEELKRAKNELRSSSIFTVIIFGVYAGLVFGGEQDAMDTVELYYPRGFNWILVNMAMYAFALIQMPLSYCFINKNNI